MNIQKSNAVSQRILPLQREKNPQFIPIKADRVTLKKTLTVDDSEARKTKLKKASQGVEAIFIRQLLKLMRSTTINGGIFGKGAVGEIYSDMMDNALAETMSKRNVFGLSDMLYRRMVEEIKPNDVNNTDS